MSETNPLANVATQEREAAKATPGPVELQSLSTRQYLDETVIPLLLEGLTILSKVCSTSPFPDSNGIFKERSPTAPDAIEWLAAFLLKNKDHKNNNGVVKGT